MRNNLGCLTLVMMLCGCSGAGEEVGGTCTRGFQGSAMTPSLANCPGCSVTEPESAVDGNGTSFASANFSTVGGEISMLAAAQASFVAGSVVGAVMRFPYVPSGPAYTNIGVSFNTYLGGALQESIAGSSTTVGNIEGGGTDQFYGGASSTPFDSVEAVINLSGAASAVRVYELCADY